MEVSCHLNASDHWIGSWVGHRAGLGIVTKRKVLSCRKSNPTHPAHRLVTAYAQPMLLKRRPLNRHQSVDRWHQLQAPATLPSVTAELETGCALRPLWMRLQRGNFLHVTGKEAWPSSPKPVIVWTISLLPSPHSSPKEPIFLKSSVSSYQHSPSFFHYLYIVYSLWGRAS
jgi:hypothetical protein